MVFLPLYLVVKNWVFPLRFCFIGLNTIMDLRTLDVCLVWDTRGDNGVFYWFTWCMFWHSTRGFPMWQWGNLCIGVDARFRPCFSVRNLGALFEVLCVGMNIMNLKLFDVCLAWDTRGENGVSYWFTWYMFWHSTHGFPRWHWGNLCIGVDARSCLLFLR